MTLAAMWERSSGWRTAHEGTALGAKGGGIGQTGCAKPQTNVPAAGDHSCHHAMPTDPLGAMLPIHFPDGDGPPGTVSSHTG